MSESAAPNPVRIEHVRGRYLLVSAAIGLAGVAITNYVTWTLTRSTRPLAPLAMGDTEINLDGQKWRANIAEYADGRPPIDATLVFEQNGAILTATVSSNSDARSWSIAGIARGRDIAYLYTNIDPQVNSFGAAVLTLSPDGKRLTGKWVGRDIDTDQMTTFPLELARVTN